MPLLDDKYKRSKDARPSLAESKLIKEPKSTTDSFYSSSNEIQLLDDLQGIKSTEDKGSKTLIYTKGFKITPSDYAIRAFSIAEKDGLSGLIFSHYDTSSQDDAVISLAWSFDAGSTLKIDGYQGIIDTNNVLNGTVYRIITTTIPHGSTFSLPQDIIENFKNLSKKIHFYVSSSIVGVEMTIFKN
jgi:hypothetical protein